MSKQGHLIVLFITNVHDRYIVGVDVNAFVSNDQLFKHVPIRVLMSQHVQRGVRDIKFVLPLCQEQIVSLRVFGVDSDDEEPKLLLIFVSENVKVVLFLIIFDFFNGTDFEQLIQVDLLISMSVKVYGVFWRGHNDSKVGVIRLEELWLPRQRSLEYS